MSTYNAVTWLLDRNIDEGRGDKLAFTDTVNELSYGELQRQSRRAANMLRRLGVRREERVAMIMLDTVDFPIVFLGAIRAGIVPVPLNTLLTADQYAYVLADSRARVLFVSEALYPVVKDIVGRMPDLECVVVSGKNAFGHKLLSEELAKESDSFATVGDPCRGAGVLALFIRLDRHAQGRAASAFQSASHRRHLCAGRCSASRRTTSVFPRQSCSLPMVSAMRSLSRCRSAPPPCSTPSGRRPR